MHKNRAENFADQKRTKTAKRTRVHAKTAEVGCVLGAGEGGSGWRRMKPGEKTRCPNPNEHQNHATHAKRKPAETQSFCRFCGRGRRTCLGCRLGRAWTQPTGLQAPTTRTAGGPAGAPRCQILPHTNEKSQVPQKRYLTFLAGAEGLEPSARGFGVDEETAHRERGRAGVARFPRQVRNRVVLLWCCGENRNGDGRKVSNFRNYCAIRQDLI